MIDSELSELEYKAKAVKQPFPCCCYSETDNATTDYIAAANPLTILELIAELRQAKAERDWLVQTLEDSKYCYPVPNSNDDYEILCSEGGCDECDHYSKKNWLQAAKINAVKLNK